MTKRWLVVVLLLAAVVPSLFAQSLIDMAPLKTDFEALMTSIGREVVPNLQQIALSGDVLGEASLDHFTFTLLAAGVTLGNGMGKILAPGAYAWEFVLPLSSLVQTAISGTNSTVQSLYGASQSVFPYPAIRFGFGLPIWAGFEFIANGFVIPQFVTDLVLPLVDPMTGGMINALKPQFSIINVGGKVRKVFLADKDWSPAFSVALGYAYSDVVLATSFDSIAKVTGPIEIPGVGTLDASGTMGFHTTVHSAGLDFHLSKRLFVFTPFLKLSTWYQYSSFVSSALMKATVTPSTSGVDPISLNLDTDTNLVISDVSVLLTGGMEINLVYVVISPSVTIDFDNPIVTVPGNFFVNFNPAGLEFNGISFNIGIRLVL
jgi:hypothetical protein